MYARILLDVYLVFLYFDDTERCRYVWHAVFREGAVFLAAGSIHVEHKRAATEIVNDKGLQQRSTVVDDYRASIIHGGLGNEA